MAYITKNERAMHGFPASGVYFVQHDFECKNGTFEEGTLVYIEKASQLNSGDTIGESSKAHSSILFHIVTGLNADGELAEDCFWVEWGYACDCQTKEKALDRFFYYLGDAVEAEDRKMRKYEADKNRKIARLDRAADALTFIVAFVFLGSVVIAQCLYLEAKSPVALLIGIAIVVIGIGAIIILQLAIDKVKATCQKRKGILLYQKGLQ